MESIGKGCIYPFEKHYITNLLKEEIERQAKELKRMREGAEKLPEGDFMRESILSAADTVEHIYLRDIKVVLERIEKTPECR